MTPLTRTTLVDDLAQFRLLEKEWDDLYRSAPGVTPFQSWAWMYSWWESYGGGYELRILVVRDCADVLVGLVPLMRDGRWGLGRLLFIGTRRNDYQDILVREGWLDVVTESVLSALRRMGGWQVADLHQLRPGSIGWTVLQQWNGSRTWIRHEGSPVVQVKPWEELVGSLSKNQRSTVRRSLRRAEADGVRVESVGSEEAGDAARRLVVLHRELWQGRNMTEEHATLRWASFIEAAARRVLSSGLGEISELRRGDEVLMVFFWLVGPGFVGFYHSGVSRQALERYQWNALLVKEGVEVARRWGATHLDLLRGEQDYKMQWASAVIASDRAVLGRGAWPWALYAGYWSAHAGLVRYLVSPRCPPWIRRSVRGVRRAVGSATRVVRL